MVTIKKPEEIKILRQAGHLLAEVLRQVAERAKPGVAFFELDQLAEKRILEAGAQPSFKDYRPRFSDTAFPSSLCVSVNNEVVHGMGNRKTVLKEGDIVGLDLGLKLQGLFVDHAVTVGVGKISKEAARLIKVTRQSLETGLKKVKPGNFIHDISGAVQKHVEKAGFSVVRDLVGHGVGYAIHEDPRIPNFVPDKGPTELVQIQAGMVLAIEPMVNAGSWKVATAQDGWTVLTEDSSWSAHFEHTVVVTARGCEILTI